MPGRVLDGPAPQLLAGLAKRGRLFGGAVRVPLVDDEPLDQPHRRGAIPAAAMNEGGLRAWRRNRGDEPVGGFRIRRASVERHVIVPESGRVHGGFLFFNLRVRLCGFTEVDDGGEPHLLDLRNGFSGVDGPRAGHRGFETREIPDACDRVFRDALGCSVVLRPRTQAASQGECENRADAHKNSLYAVSSSISGSPCWRRDSLPSNAAEILYSSNRPSTAFAATRRNSASR